MDEPVIYYNIHRNLAETVYLIRFYFIRLTEFDVLVVTAVALLTWTLVDTLEWRTKRYGSSRLTLSATSPWQR